MRSWALRISYLLDINLPTPTDGISPYFCSKCCRRVERLEKAVSELAEFRRLANESHEIFQHHGRKRPKETSSNEGITPDTAKARPPVKRRGIAGGRRLDFGPATAGTDGESLLQFSCPFNNA